MASSPFPTPTELKHFRRITWLLGHEAFKDLDINEKPPTFPTTVDKRLPLLKSLAILLVRNYEVVAVMPYRNGTEIVINEALASNSNSNSNSERNHEDSISKEWLIARNYRWRDDRPEDNGGMSAEENHGLSVTAQTIEDTNSGFDPRDAVPTRFEDHVRVVIAMLKERAQLEKLEDRSSIRRRLFTYTTRACLFKIATRAAYHCTPVAKAIGAHKGILDNLEDFARFLPPPPSWEKQVRDEANSLGSEKDSVDNSLNAFIESIGIEQDEDDTWWSSCKTLGKHLSKLKTYALEEPLKRDVEMECEGEGDSGLNLKEGFYLVAANRRAYHKAFTSILASCLFYLQLLVKNLENKRPKGKNNSERKSIAEQCSSGSPTEKLIVLCRNSLVGVYNFVSQSQILGIHIEWYLASTGNEAKTKGASGLDKAVEEDEEAVEENEKDPEEDLEEDQEDEEDQNEYFSNRVTKFDPDNPLTKSIVRWLRLLTEHQHSVMQLTKDRHTKLLCVLRVHVLRTAMSKQDDESGSEMESLDECLTKFVKDPHDRNTLVRTLQKPRKYVDFHGAYHCEAILASLYLLTRHNLHHNAVPGELERKAAMLYPFICAVSKKCCPVCATIYSVVNSDAKGIAITGTHSKFFPCRLPPWFPREDALRVTQKLETYLSYLITEKVQKIHHRRDSSTSSVGTADTDENDAPNRFEPEY